MIKAFHSKLISTPHAFFSKRGGVSQNNFKSLNCGKNKGDDANDVIMNRRLCLEYLTKKYTQLQDPKLVLAIQTHSNKAIFVDDILNDPLPEADALVTKNPNLILGVLTADCCPILLHEPKTKMVAAIHAGWRGALSGIIENTLDLMQEKGAIKNNIYAAIGPCLWSDYFEVQKDWINMATKESSLSLDSFIILQEDKTFFDFPNYIFHKLKSDNIQNIEPSIRDTYKNDDLFFSYRRTTHLNEKSFGVQLSAIGTTL